MSITDDSLLQDYTSGAIYYIKVQVLLALVGNMKVIKLRKSTLKCQNKDESYTQYLTNI